MFRFGQAFRQTPSSRSLPKLVLAIFLTVALVWGVAAKTNPETPHTDATVSLASLPAEARQMQQSILNGGPFSHRKDGTVFGNRERHLPPEARGYYKEYTVKTPGSKDRGARRIVCGGQQPAQPDACFYTADHYASFQRIVP